MVEEYFVEEVYTIPPGEALGDESYDVIEEYTTTITVPAVAAQTKAVTTTATRVKQ